MRVLAHQGMPPRGSFRDCVAKEMVVRERRAQIATAVYQGRLVAASYTLHPAVFDAITRTYVDEVTHGNYNPEIVNAKKAELAVFHRKRTEDPRLAKRVEQLTVTDSSGYVPYSPEEREKALARIRARTLKNAVRVTPDDK